MIIKIDSEICNKIEALQYEVESRKDIITSVIAGTVSMKGDLFEKYHNEYQEFFKQYNKAKQEMTDKYITDPALKNKAWNLTFNTCELTIED